MTGLSTGVDGSPDGSEALPQSSDPTQSSSRQKISSQGDLIIALALAFGTLAFLVSQTSGLEALVGQFSKYPVAASNYLNGTLTGERLFDYSQLYLWLCIAASKLFLHPFNPLLWVQLSLLSLADALLYLTLRRYFHRRPALFGALGFVLTPSVTIYGYVFEPEALMVALLVLLAYTVSSRRTAFAFFAGTTLSLCLLTRPAFFVLALFIPVFYYFRRPEQPTWRRETLLFLLPVLGSLLFFSQYTHRQKQNFPPPLMSPGSVFFEGNNPIANGRGAAYPKLLLDLAEDFPGESDYQHALYRLSARRATIPELSAPACNTYWVTKALNFIQDEPATFLHQELRKAFYILHSYRWHDLRVAEETDLILQRRFIPFLPLGIFSVLALLGSVVSGKRWRYFLPFYAILFSQAGLMLATYASDRQRLSLLPFLIFFAVAGLEWTLRAKLRRRLPATLALLFLLGPALSMDTGRMQDNRSVWSSYIQIRDLREDVRNLQNQRETAAAVKLYARVLALAPWLAPAGQTPAELPMPSQGWPAMALEESPKLAKPSPSALLNQAILMIEAGELDQAEQVLLQLQSADARFEPLVNRIPEPEFYLGRIAWLKGEVGSAVDHQQRALARWPGDPRILAELAALTGNSGYSGRLFRYFDPADGDYYLGCAYLRTGHPREAVEAFSKLDRLVPEFWRGKIFRAAALSDAGEDRKAVVAYLEAMQKRTDPVFFPVWIRQAFRNQAAQAGPDDVAWYWYGKVLRQTGDFTEARKVFSKLFQATGKSVVGRELEELTALP